jgi:uncharacterized protein YlaN (UPF0358 family)
MKKTLLLVLVPVMMAVLIQCVSVPQRWPAYERRTEDRMFALQQRIGNGLASGELAPNEAQNLLGKLENIRREYTVLRERRTTAEEWDPLLGRLDDLEREVNRVRAQPSRIDETRIEDRMIVLQRRIDACPGKGISIEIRCHSKGFFATDKRPTLHPGGKSRDFQPT